MLTWLLWLACGSTPTPDLPADGALARDKMAQSLQSRDPAEVSRHAREAARWEGQDPALDRLLGDALANVLMHPEDGLRLLQANPLPGDPDWEKAHLAATMRSGNAAAMESAFTATGRPSLNFNHTVVQQMVRRMLSDPQIGPEVMIEAIADCTLIDAQPNVGRKVLDQPARPDLLMVAPMVGAIRTVLARPVFRGDPEPSSSRGPLFCNQKVLIADGWPTPLPRTMTVGLTDGVHHVFIDIKVQDGEAWAFATSDATAAGRWVQATQLLATPGGEEVVRERYREGLWSP